MKVCTSKAAIFFMVTASCATAAAQWQFEPTTFMGITLSEDVLAQVSECTEPRPPTLCRQATATNGEYVLFGLPYIGVTGNQSATVILDEGRLQSMYLAGDADSFHGLGQALTTHYGMPTERENQLLEMSPGIMFGSEVMTWTGQSMNMQLRRDPGDPRKYTLSITMLQTASEFNATAESHH